MKCKKCKNEIGKDGVCPNCGYKTKREGPWIVILLLILAVGIGIGTLFLVLTIKNMQKREPLDATENLSIDEYFEKTSDLKSVIDANESEDVTTGEETYELLYDRGFEECLVTASYNMDGEIVSDTEIEDDSSEKYPMYSAYYVSKTEEMWVINVVNGTVTAYPLNYNMDSEGIAETLIVESSTIMSYDGDTNKFYENKPYEEYVIMKKVKKITADTLDKLDAEEIDEL